MKRQLKKIDKLRFKHDFDFVRSKGTKVVSSGIVLVYVKEEVDNIKCGVVCGKKYSTRAVHRNRARRLLWESFRLLKGEILFPCQMILIPRRRIENFRRQDATKELAKLFYKINLVKKEVSDFPPEC